MLLTFSTVASDTDLLLYKYVNGRPERARERERPSLTLNQSSQQEEAEKLLVCRLRKETSVGGANVHQIYVYGIVNMKSTNLLNSVCITSVEFQ